MRPIVVETGAGLPEVTEMPHVVDLTQTEALAHEQELPADCDDDTIDWALGFAYGIFVSAMIIRWKSGR